MSRSGGYYLLINVDDVINKYEEEKRKAEEMIREELPDKPEEYIDEETYIYRGEEDD